jgi:hypothetical protein
MRDYDGSVIQMRMAYSAVAHFLVQWTDCRLASALGLLKIMIFKVDYFFLLPLQNRFLPCEFTCVLLRAATEYINFDQFRILRTQVYPDDGTTSMPAWEREANIREFYGRHLSNQSVTLFPPSLGSDSFLPVLPASPGWLQEFCSRRCFSCPAESLSWTTRSRGGYASTGSGEGMPVSRSWIWRGSSSAAFASRPTPRSCCPTARTRSA